MMTEKEDIQAFMAEMSDVARIDNDDKVFLKKATDADALAQQLRREAIALEHNRGKNYLTLADIDPVPVHDPIQFKQSGVQDQVFKNLRLGKYPIDSTLNIQHLTLKMAHQSVFEGIVQSQQKGCRCLLIRNGLSLNKKPFSGFIKSYLNVWLTQMPEVIAFHSAATQQGGIRATYVLLKKNKEQKAENRELHRKK